jgi:hypothetical protein
MSELTPTAQKDSPPGPSPPRPRRWVDTFTAALVCAAVGIVAFSVAPEVLRAAGLVGPGHEVAPRPGGRISLLPHGGELPSHPLFSPEVEDEDDRRETELERAYPDGMWPGRRSPEERRRDRQLFPRPSEGRDAPDQDGPRVHEPRGPHAGAGEARARFGVVRHRIELLDSPVEAQGSPADPPSESRVLGHVESGKLVMVIKEIGDFALVAYSGDDGVLMGWTKKSEIAVR